MGDDIAEQAENAREQRAASVTAADALRLVLETARERASEWRIGYESADANVRKGEWILTELVRITRERDEAIEALRDASSALDEATAILGGEYGDHYGVLCDRMLKLETRVESILASHKENTDG